MASRARVRGGRGVLRRGAPVVTLGVVMALLGGCTPQFDVAHLAGDPMAGRQNLTTGSALSQDYLIGHLDLFGDGANTAATGDDAFRQVFPEGTNLVGIIPGTDLADEYVVIGAHYDGLGTSCSDRDPSENICNGATDNATGVAGALSVAAGLFNDPAARRRSIVLAFWDAEEDDLKGSLYFAEHPLVPLSAIVGYINFDIQGANLRPSLRDTSFAVAAETGGPRLREIVQDAIDANTLTTRQLSAVFGLYRSDYVAFMNKQVPTVFFTDSTGPCYHTDDDELAVVDFGKLDRQIAIAKATANELASTDDPPAFAAGQPLTTYADWAEIRGLIDTMAPDIPSFSPSNQIIIANYVDQVDAIVDAGPGAFDSDAALPTLIATADVVEVLRAGPCSGFLAP